MIRKVLIYFGIIKSLPPEPLPILFEKTICAHVSKKQGRSYSIVLRDKNGNFLASAVNLKTMNKVYSRIDALSKANITCSLNFK